MRKNIFLLSLFVLISLVFLNCSNSADNAGSSTQQIKNRGGGKENWWESLPRPAWSNFEKISQSQEWFEVYKVLPGIYAIYEPGQFDEVISYLITGTEKTLLFDTGLGIGDIKKVVSELTNLEVIVLNSHTHYDHIGGNHQFDKICSMNREYTRNNSQGLPHDKVKEFVGEGWIWKTTPETFSADQYSIKPFKITKFIENGEKIDLDGRPLTVSPGRRDLGNRV